MDRDRGSRPDRNGGDRGGFRGGRDHGDRGGIKPNYFLPKPVKVGDVVEVTIEAEASKGDGIAKKDGFVIFVKDAKQGDIVKAKITDVRARYALAQIAEAGESSAPAEDAASEESSEEESEESSEEEA